jgi:Ca2+-binding RTX toxin-like protein
MKSLTRNGIILMMALALGGAIAGYGVYTTIAQGQALGVCHEGGCFSTLGNEKDFPTDGDDIISLGPTPPGDIDGGVGNDKIFNNVLPAGGNCTGGSPTTTYRGGAGNDLLVDNNDGNDLAGDEGNDLMFGNGGNDCLDGGDGDDLIEGGDGDDTISEGAGNDLVRGGPGEDVYPEEDGSPGNDTYVFNAGDVPANGFEEIFDLYCPQAEDGQSNVAIFVGFGATSFGDQDANKAGLQVQDPITGGWYSFPNYDPSGEQPCDSLVGF